jgi:hypothetical protein
MHRHLGNRSNCIARPSLCRDRRRRSGPEAGLNACLLYSLANYAGIEPKKRAEEESNYRDTAPSGPPVPRARDGPRALPHRPGPSSPAFAFPGVSA